MENKNAQNEQKKERCPFDMFVRYQPGLHTKQTFCYRGDYPDIKENNKMLCSLLRFFMRRNYQWKLAEIYDNFYPKNDNRRLIFRYANGVIEVNKLHNYANMLTEFPMPDWMK